MTTTEVFLGIDAGTSGIRGCCINHNGDELASHHVPIEAPNLDTTRVTQDPYIWRQAMHQLIESLVNKIRPLQVVAIAIDGTSGTLVACDNDGNPLSFALMYNDTSCTEETVELSRYLPSHVQTTAAVPTSLAKARLLTRHSPEAQYLCHQADWLTGYLSHRYDITDTNNALKLGYDVINHTWPEWITSMPWISSLLPQVVEPGSVISPVHAQLAPLLGLPGHCKVVAGTTDSTAAFLATGAKAIGDAVTSLGSTLVLKIISDKPVFAPQFGIYSHRLKNYWLAGGASNSGGRVLLEHFNQAQIDHLTTQLQPGKSTGLNYYPLPGKGERFPRNDPGMTFVVDPKPDNDVIFFQGLLEGIAKIEKEGYLKLNQLGTPSPKQILTVGGGSQNQSWNLIRERILDIPVSTAKHTEASYGAALLAKEGYT